MKNRLVLIVGLLIASVAQASWIYSLGGTLVISGKIEKGDRQRVEKRLNGDTKKITIMSPGGDVEEGLAIGALIRRSEKLLVVRKYCLSACGLIFVMAHRRAMDEGGFVAFHAGEYALRLSVLASLKAYEPKTDEYRAHFEAKKSELENAWKRRSQLRESTFADAGLDYAWHQKMVDLTASKLLSVDVNETTRVITTAATPAQCDWWIPDQQGLQEIGIAVKTYKLPDKQEMAKRLEVPVDRIYWGSLSDLNTLTAKPCADPRPGAGLLHE